MDEQQDLCCANNTYTDKTICDLLTTFSQNTYNANETDNPHLINVMSLMERDYTVYRVSNENGSLCFQYPSIIPIMTAERSVCTIYENEENQPLLLQVPDLIAAFQSAKLARCRQRFPVPVICFKGYSICRSATLASLPEICYRGNFSQSRVEILTAIKAFLWPSEESSPEVANADAENIESRVPPYCDNIRNEDLRLLQLLHVKNIVDIMVEKRKVKHGLYVSASEKVDRDRYVDFNLISLPYPGCEFFTQYSNSLFETDKLRYDWSSPSNDAEISVPNDQIKNILGINFPQYRTWDLVPLTQNYMRYILKRLQEDKAGLLLHCISGWDRTPLFISLIRLSLWADGLVHENLNEYEIVYLCVAYDWYLFGHHLSNRISKNEEIMAFCFDFLKFITSEEYSAKPLKKRHSDERSDDSRCPSRTSVISDPEIYRKPFSDMSIHDNDYTMLDISFEDVAEDIDMDDANDGNDAEAANLEKYMCSLYNNMSKTRVVSPTSMAQLKTSPILVGSPQKRQRSTSTGSTASWQLVTDCGSIENEPIVKTLRHQKLDAARSIFMSCYQKTVKSECYGPPKSVVEDVVMYLTSFLDGLKPGQDTKPTESSNTKSNGFHAA